MPAPMQTLVRFVVRIENAYEDGFEQINVETFDAPPLPEDATARDQWFEDHVWDLTGTGHSSVLGSIYEASITEADQPEAIGAEHSWGG